MLYLHGLSSSDFAPALEQFLGTGHGLLAATITRLTEQWKHDATKFGQRSLKDVDYVYLWVDGIHLKVRLEQAKVCLLVMIGVRADGRKELVALADGFRESAESGLDPFDCREPGRCAVVVVSRLNPVRFDGGDIPSIAGVERRSQLFLTDGVRASIGTIVTEAHHIQGSIMLGHRRQSRHVSWSLAAVEGVEQPAVQHRLKPAPQTLQLERVSRSELNLDPAVVGLRSGDRQPPRFNSGS